MKNYRKECAAAASFNRILGRIAGAACDAHDETMRILVAEDDFASRKFIVKFMEEYGDCEAAVDGMEAVDAYTLAREEGVPYDLICLDVMMPIMDGYQVLKAIRDIENEEGIADDKQVKIIMMTALSQEQYVKKACDMGCTIYCAKPLDLDKLRDVMGKLGILPS